ncbi:MAG: PRC-barrel domain-containing protein [Pseudomonadota bacterium]|nr:PRC-barrel domain-containing protein [Pseudomonadota bacterium]
MDISTQLHHDHAGLTSLGQDILTAADGGDVGGRDNQFDLYDLQVRRHLAVVEEVMLAPLKKDPAASDACADVKARHKTILADLATLDRAGKGGHEWTAEFRGFVARFDAVCSRHEALIAQAERVAPDLAKDYEQAKLRRVRGGPWSWNRVAPSSTAGTVAAVAGAAAAVAGAAFAARYFSSGRRSAGRADDDFELRLETDETLRLISSSKVEGTSVVDRTGAKIGAIDSFMVDKYTGRVAYAVMKFGGTASSLWTGFGASLFPLPWPVLDYDEANGGYMLDVAKEDMANAPRFEASATPEFDADYRREVLLFYRPQPGRDAEREDITGMVAEPTLAR